MEKAGKMKAINNVIKTSIIIPVYNTQSYLRECLNSVLNQTQREIEIIAIDDGSTDGSIDILREYENMYDNVIILQQENKKLGAARNAGLAIAKGQYIFFLDSDDYLDLETLELLYNKAISNDLDIVFFDGKAFKDNENVNLERLNINDTELAYSRNSLNIDDKKIWTGYEFLNEYYNKGGVYVNSTLMYFKESFLKRYDFKFQEGVFYEDVEFGIKSYMKAKKIMYLPSRFYYRRYRSDSIVLSNYTLLHLFSYFKACLMVWKHIVNDGNSSEMKWATRAFLSGIMESAINAWNEMGDIDVSQFEPRAIEFLNGFLNVSLDIFFENWDLSLSEQIKIILDKLINQQYKISEIYELYKRIDVWYNKFDEEFLNKKICIYGTGKIAEKVINYFKKFDLIVTKTFIEDKYLEFHGIKIIPITELERHNINIILIGSIDYEDEMCAKINELYSGKVDYITYRQYANKVIQL